MGLISSISRVAAWLAVFLLTSALTMRATEPYRRTYTVEAPVFEDSATVIHSRSNGTGASKTREGAVAKALEEAVSRQGTVISSEIQLALQAESRRTNGQTTSSGSQKVSADFTRATGGLVRWWEVLSESYDGDLHTVEITCVMVRTTEAAGQHPSRKTIAVIPFRAGAGDVPATQSERRITSLLTQSLLTQLATSRKFAMLDDTFSAELDKLARENPESDPVERALHLASKLGAEYAVTGLADGVGMRDEQVGGMVVTTAAGAVMLRVIDTKRRQVVLASRIPARDISLVSNGSPASDSDLAAGMATALSNRILDTIYPLRVIALSADGELTLNRGGEDIPGGAEYDVYNVGEQLTDPSTGESLGLSERKVACIRITQVNPKVSHATVVSSTEAITVNAVCRKPTKVRTQTPANKPAKKANSLFD